MNQLWIGSVLRHLDPHLLLQLLGPFAAALAARGVAIEPDREPDFAALGRVLMHPDEQTPIELIEALCLIEDVAGDDTYDQLRDEARRAGIAIDGDLPAPELALRVYLADKSIIERMHAERLSTKPRKFESFSTSVEPVPRIGLPADAAVQALEAALGADFVDHHRGRGVPIFPFQTEAGFSWNPLRMRGGAVASGCGARGAGAGACTCTRFETACCAGLAEAWGTARSRRLDPAGEAFCDPHISPPRDHHSGWTGLRGNGHSTPSRTHDS